MKALAATARQHNHIAHLIEAVETVNNNQKSVIVDKIKKHFGNDLRGKTFALWGLAFKPNTDDMREAPSLVIMNALWEAGATVQAYDPKAMDEARHIVGTRDGFILADSPEGALKNADALILATEWKVFQLLDISLLKKSLKTPVIFDGRNIYNPEKLRAEGFSYYAIGR